MKIINLRLHYPRCQQDKLVEVSEEVFDVLCQSVREMRNYERRKQIADRERVHNSNVCLSIRRGLCNLRRYYADYPQGK